MLARRRKEHSDARLATLNKSLEDGSGTDRYGHVDHTAGRFPKPGRQSWRSLRTKDSDSRGAGSSSTGDRGSLLAAPDVASGKSNTQTDIGTSHAAGKHPTEGGQLSARVGSARRLLAPPDYW